MPSAQWRGIMQPFADDGFWTPLARDERTAGPRYVHSLRVTLTFLRNLPVEISGPRRGLRLTQYNK